MVCVVAAAVLPAAEVSERGGFPTTTGFFAGPRAEHIAYGAAAFVQADRKGTYEPASDLLSHAARCPTAFRGGVCGRPQPAGRQ
jgi:hypothetical protein